MNACITNVKTTFYEHFILSCTLFLYELSCIWKEWTLLEYNLNFYQTLDDFMTNWMWLIGPIPYNLCISLVTFLHGLVMIPKVQGCFVHKTAQNSDRYTILSLICHLPLTLNFFFAPPPPKPTGWIRPCKCGPMTGKHSRTACSGTSSRPTARDARIRLMHWESSGSVAGWNENPVAQTLGGLGCLLVCLVGASMRRSWVSLKRLRLWAWSLMGLPTSVEPNSWACACSTWSPTWRLRTFLWAFMMHRPAQERLWQTSLWMCSHVSMFQWENCLGSHLTMLQRWAVCTRASKVDCRPWIPLLFTYRARTTVWIWCSKKLDERSFSWLIVYSS